MDNAQSPVDSPSVLSEIVAGQGIALSAAARRLPPTRQGRPVATTTLWRWACHGARSPDGRLVKLEIARAGCRWLTSESALLRFLAALQPLAAGTEAAPKKHGRAAAALAKAQAELSAAGI
jgi:hypothetical protein